MKLALYLPNFRDHVTVKELEDLTNLAEELEFDSVWTLDRIVVPEASDREELQYAFGMMEGFPKQLPVSSRGQWFQGWPLIPWLAAKTSKCRIGMSITDTPYRSPGVFAAEVATIDHLSSGRRQRGPRRRLDARGVRGGQCLAHLPQASQARARDDRDLSGHLDERAVRVPRRVRRLRTVRIRPQAAAGPAPADLHERPADPKRSANRIAKYNLSGWIGIQDTPDELEGVARRRSSEELEELGEPNAIDELEIVQHVLVRDHRRAH